MHKKRLFLASQSKRREKILTDWGVDFTPVFLETEEVKGKTPEETVIQNALNKARKASSGIMDGIIIGADTVVAIDSLILGKPGSKEESIKFIEMLEGKTHFVFTGIALIEMPHNIEVAGYEKSFVSVRKLTLFEKENYFKNKDIFDKAGAYAIQEIASSFIIKTEGPIDNIMGFPFLLFQNLLLKIKEKIKEE